MWDLGKGKRTSVERAGACRGVAGGAGVYRGECAVRGEMMRCAEGAGGVSAIAIEATGTVHLKR